MYHRIICRPGSGRTPVISRYRRARTYTERRISFLPDIQAIISYMKMQNVDSTVKMIRNRFQSLFAKLYEYLTFENLSSVAGEGYRAMGETAYHSRLNYTKQYALTKSSRFVYTKSKLSESFLRINCDSGKNSRNSNIFFKATGRKGCVHGSKKLMPENDLCKKNDLYNQKQSQCLYLFNAMSVQC